MIDTSLAAFTAFAQAQPRDKAVQFMDCANCFLAQWGRSLFPGRAVGGGSWDFRVYNAAGMIETVYGLEWMPSTNHPLGEAKTWGEAADNLAALLIEISLV